MILAILQIPVMFYLLQSYEDIKHFALSDITTHLKKKKKRLTRYVTIKLSFFFFFIWKCRLFESAQNEPLST